MTDPISEAFNLAGLLDFPTTEVGMLEWILELAVDSSGLDKLDHKYTVLLAEGALESFQAKDYRSLIYFVFTLGRMRGHSDEVLGEERKSSAEYARKINRLKPAMGKKLVKKVAQMTATILWNLDKSQSYRVTKMTELVCLELPSAIETHIEILSTGNESGQYQASCLRGAKIPSIKKVREWVSAISPPHAKKPGRPKSNSK